MAKDLSYAIEIKLAGNASTYTNSNIGVTNGIMRLHTGRGNLTLNTNTYYPDLLTDIGTIENTVDFYELGGYRPFIQFEFGVFDAGLLSELKANDTYLKNAEVTVFIGLGGSYTAECVGCVERVSDQGDIVMIGLADLTLTRDGITDIFTVGEFKDTAKLGLELVEKFQKNDHNLTIYVGDTLDIDSNLPDNDQRIRTLVFSATGMPYIIIGSEDETSILANPNFVSWENYLQSLGASAYSVVAVDENGDPSGIVHKVVKYSVVYDSDFDVYSLWLYLDRASEFTRTEHTNQSITTLGSIIRIQRVFNLAYLSKERSLGSFPEFGFGAEYNNNFKREFLYGLSQIRSPGLTVPYEAGRFSFDYDGLMLEVPTYKNIYTSYSIGSESGTLFNETVNKASFDFNAGSGLYLGQTTIDYTGSTQSCELKLFLNLDGSFVKERTKFRPVFSIRLSEVVGSSGTFTPTNIKLTSFSGTGFKRPKETLANLPLLTEAQIYTSVLTNDVNYISNGSTAYIKSCMPCDLEFEPLYTTEAQRYTATQLRLDLPDFFVYDQKIAANINIDRIQLFITITFSVDNPVPSTSTTVNAYCDYLGIESEKQNVLDFPASITGETWANDTNAPSGATGSPTNQTEVARYLTDIYGEYTPATDYVSDIYSDTWAEKSHIQSLGNESLKEVLNTVYENTYGLMTGIQNGQRRLIDLRGLSETTYSSVVRNFTGVEIQNFQVMDTPTQKIYNSFKVNYCKNYSEDELLFYCNAIINPDYSGMEITTNQEGEDSSIFNSSAESLAELCQYSANLYNYINVLEIDVPSLDFRDGDAVTRFIYEIAKITAFRRREYKFSIAYDDYASDRVYVGDKIALTNFVRTANNTVYGMVTHVGIDAYNSGAVEIQFSSLQIDRPVSSVLDEQTAYSVTIINEQDGSTTTIDEA